MTVTDVDGQSRLFYIQDLLPAELVEDICNLDWINLPYGTQPGQETWARRLVASNVGILVDATRCIHQVTEQIGEQIGIELRYPGTGWWVDLPGFTVDIHTDGHMPCSMQMFWVMPTEQHATQFYNSKRQHDIRFAPKSVTNTGYLMLNKSNTDGSQPLQWHGMLNPVPAGTIRVCSYTHFGDYDHKYTYERN